jgi:hypothetical protein
MQLCYLFGIAHLWAMSLAARAAMTLRKSPRVTRKQTALMLTCTVQNVRWLEKHGHLRTGRKGTDGGVTYDREEVERVANHRRSLRLYASTADAVEAFKLFAKGVSLDKVVTTIGLHPDVVFDLRLKFDRGYDRETSEERRARQRRELLEDEEIQVSRLSSVDAFIDAFRRSSANPNDSSSPSRPTDSQPVGPSVRKSMSLDDDPEIQRARAAMARAHEAFGVAKKPKKE